METFCPGTAAPVGPLDALRRFAVVGTTTFFLPTGNQKRGSSNHRETAERKESGEKRSRRSLSSFDKLRTGSWPGGPGRLPARGSHRSVRARIRAYGSSGRPSAGGRRRRPPGTARPAAAASRVRFGGGPASLSAGLTLTRLRGTKSPACVRPAVGRPGAPLPSARSPRAGGSRASRVLLGRCDFPPPLPPRSVAFARRYRRCLRRARRFAPPGPGPGPGPGRGARGGLGPLRFGRPGPIFLRRRRLDLPSSRGTPMSRSPCSRDPGGTSAPDRTTLRCGGAAPAG